MRAIRQGSQCPPRGIGRRRPRCRAGPARRCERACSRYPESCAWASAGGPPGFRSRGNSAPPRRAGRPAHYRNRDSHWDGRAPASPGAWDHWYGRPPPGLAGCPWPVRYSACRESHCPRCTPQCSGDCGRAAPYPACPHATIHGKISGSRTGSCRQSTGRTSRPSPGSPCGRTIREKPDRADCAPPECHSRRRA